MASLARSDSMASLARGGERRALIPSTAWPLAPTPRPRSRARMKGSDPVYCVAARSDSTASLAGATRRARLLRGRSLGECTAVDLLGRGQRERVHQRDRLGQLVVRERVGGVRAEVLER